MKKLIRGFAPRHFCKMILRNSPLKELNDGEESGEECPICMTNIVEDSRILSCNHAFHASCIGRWLDEDACEAKRSCPTCRNVEIERSERAPSQPCVGSNVCPSAGRNNQDIHSWLCDAEYQRYLDDVQECEVNEM